MVPPLFFQLVPPLIMLRTISIASTCALFLLFLCAGCGSSQTGDDTTSNEGPPVEQISDEGETENVEGEIQLRDDLTIAARGGRSASIMIAAGNGRVELSPAEAQRLAATLHRAAFDIADETAKRGIIGPIPEPTCEPQPESALMAVPGGVFAPCPTPMFDPSAEQAQHLFNPDAFGGEVGEWLERSERVPGGFLLPEDALR